MKNGDLKPLFMGKTKPVPYSKWLQAENIPTKGFAHRPRWYAGVRPFASHLTEKGLVWCEVEVKDWDVFERPLTQGGEIWLVAKWLRVIRELKPNEVKQLGGE